MYVNTQWNSLLNWLVLLYCLYPQSQLNAVFPPKIFDATLFVMLKVVKNKLKQKVM